jgi:hypothetical protein
LLRLLLVFFAFVVAMVGSSDATGPAPRSHAAQA